MCAAFIQLYREDAHYLERTAPWIERVGLDYVKARLVDDPRRSRGARRALPHLAEASAGRSLGRSAPAGDARSARAHGRSPPAQLEGMRMIGKWLDIGPVDPDRTAAPRARCRSRAARRSPCSAPMSGECLRAGQQVPAQGRAAQPGHRPRRQRHLPAAQLEHLARDRRGAGRGQGLRADDPGEGRRRRGCYLLREAVLAEGAGGVSDERRSAPPAPIAASAAASSRRRRRAARSRSRAIRASGQSRQALLEGHASRRDGRASKGGCSIPMIGGKRASWDKATRSGRAALSPTRSRGTARTASPSTSRASC